VKTAAAFFDIGLPRDEIIPSPHTHELSSWALLRHPPVGFAIRGKTLRKSPGAKQGQGRMDDAVLVDVIGSLRCIDRSIDRPTAAAVSSTDTTIL
jgi:hypothetical protein